MPVHLECQGESYQSEPRQFVNPSTVQEQCCVRGNTSQVATIGRGRDVDASRTGIEPEIVELPQQSTASRELLRGSGEGTFYLKLAK